MDTVARVLGVLTVVLAVAAGLVAGADGPVWARWALIVAALACLVGELVIERSAGTEEKTSSAQRHLDGVKGRIFLPLLVVLAVALIVFTDGDAVAVAFVSLVGAVAVAEAYGRWVHPRLQRARYSAGHRG